MRFLHLALVASLLTLISWSSSAGSSNSGGAIQFSVYVKPSGGQVVEPVRQLTFYLLSRSLSDIRKEVETINPPVDIDHFVAKLEVSPELKDWMTKHHRIDFVGNEFVQEVTPEDVVTVPEFLKAYREQNGAALHAGVPEPKYKAGDEQKDPEKYKRQQEQYRQALIRYIQAHPDLMQGFDAEFSESNPHARWMKIQTEQQHRIEQQVMQLAQTRYLVRSCVTDLNGLGSFDDLKPGQYWLSNLDTPALTGDLRLQWDVEVMVSAANTAHIDLSNLNSIQTSP